MRQHFAGVTAGTTRGCCAFVSRHRDWVIPKNDDATVGRGRDRYVRQQTERAMECTWTPWRPFSNPLGGVRQARSGPGVYEVRKIADGEVVAFGYSGRVAHELAKLRPNPASPSWMRHSMRKLSELAPSELEYRICPAATKDEAKMMARSLLGRRQVFFRRRLNPAWA